MTQACDSTCWWCAKHFFDWHKAQVKKFDMPPKPGTRASRSGPGNFNLAASTSIKGA